MMDNKMTALELVLTLLTMFGSVTRESLTAVCVLFEAVLSYDYATGKFDKGAVKKVSEVADHLLAMAELYGVKCEPRQLETPGGRRAILRVILGPVLKGLTLESLELIRNDAVEAMMVLTFKPCDEVQDMVDVWAEQAIADGRYQSRVYSWTGQLMDEIAETTVSANINKPIADEQAIAAVGRQCALALEIMFTFLTMFGPVTEESVEAAVVLFGAVLGYSEATGKFDKETVKKVPMVAEQLCGFARLYGIKCEPRTLNTPLGARAILREIVGPIIEGHSPEELKRISDDAMEVDAAVTRAPLDLVNTLATTWAKAARQDGRYQTRASAWTGKPVDAFNEDDLFKPSQVSKMPRACIGPQTDVTDECQNFDSVSENSLQSTNYLEIATSATIVQLITVQALFSMDLLPKEEVQFTTLFPSPLDVCLGRAVTSINSFSGNHVDAKALGPNAKSAPDGDEMDDAKELVDASDEEDYHRLVGFHFPALPPTPALDTSGSSTPSTTLMSPTFEQWMTTWHDQEMSTWKAVLQGAVVKESQAKEREVMFRPYADAWEDKQLGGWLVALKDDDGDDCLPRIHVDTINDEELVETLGSSQVVQMHSGMNLLKTIGRFFGLA